MNTDFFPTRRRALPMLGLSLLAAPWARAQGAGIAAREGTYFIVNVATGLALQPLTPMAGNNVFLYPYNRGGTQRWVLKPVLDARTRKPTGRVTIQLDGPAPLYLQPYPTPDHTAIMGTARSASYQLRAAGDGRHEIRNHQLNGDALHAVPVAHLPTEAQFGPSNGSVSFLWDFVPAD